MTPKPDHTAELLERVAQARDRHRNVMDTLGAEVEALEGMAADAGTIVFRFRRSAYELVSFALRSAGPEELIETWCSDSDPPAVREEFAALIRAVAAGCTLGDFLESDSAVSWLRQHVEGT